MFPTDPSDIADFAKGLQGTINIARGADTTIASAPVHAYVTQTDTTNSSVSETTTVYVASDTGLPQRAVSGGSVSGQTGQATIDYYDFGVPITISLPACE